MTDREVTCTCKDDAGNIECLGGDWGQVSKDEAIDQINSGSIRYWVRGVSGTEVEVHVVGKHTPPYLRTDPDGTAVNNLDELPDC
jgi:hypothetical protein